VLLAVVVPAVVLEGVDDVELALGTEIVETALSGYSAEAPATTRSGTPPFATWDESTPVTTPVVAAAPFWPGIMTVAPIRLLAVARL
jgi:hypothetical protein